MLTKLKASLKTVLPRPLYDLLRAIHNKKDLSACIFFLRNSNLNVSLQDKIRIVKSLYVISSFIESPHTQEQILNYLQTIFQVPRNSKGVLVEAGCYKGSSTAKFSLAADIVRRQLVVFDSFQGIPDNHEPHERNIFGTPASFKKGDWCGTLDEVKTNISKFGKINCCRFIPGWFDDTMPRFKESICAAYLDVDLASSTRTCLKYLYRLLEPSGVLYSQDGHLPLVIDVFDDDAFWLNEVGCKKPQILGLGKNKLVKIIKEA